MDAQSLSIVLQIITLLWWVSVYFFSIRKDLELIKKDINLMKVDVSKVEWIESYIKPLSNYFSDWKFKSVPDRLKNYKVSEENRQTQN